MDGEQVDQEYKPMNQQLTEVDPIQTGFAMDMLKHLGEEKVDLMRRYAASLDNVTTEEDFRKWVGVLMTDSLNSFVSDAKEHLAFEQNYVEHDYSNVVI
jgi:hypothetical protein